MTNYEEEAAAEEERNTYSDTVRNGLAALEAAREAAQADVETATTLRQQALALADSVTTLKGQVDSFTAAPTYQPAQLNAVRVALAQVCQAQLDMAYGMAEFYQYRKANDQVAIGAHRSLEYLARYLLGE